MPGLHSPGWFLGSSVLLIPNSLHCSYTFYLLEAWIRDSWGTVGLCRAIILEREREYPLSRLSEVGWRCLMQTHRFSKPSDIFLPVQASLRDSHERLRRRFYEWWRFIKSDVGCGCPPRTSYPPLPSKTTPWPETRAIRLFLAADPQWYIDRRTTLAILD